MRNNTFLFTAFSFSLACCGQAGITLHNDLIEISAPEKTLPLIDEDGKTIRTRFNTPEGYRRTIADTNSFASYLRQLPLKPAGSPVLYFDGQEKNTLVHDAVVDMDIGSRDLQQCADAIMRLHAEYLFSTRAFDKISFVFTNGFRANYSEWIKGYRIAVDGNKTSWKKSAQPSNTYSDFRNYMNIVFTYAGTLSLSKTLKPKSIHNIAPGDVFIRGGLPGHAVIVIDVAEGDSGEKVFLLAQSFMPAQDIHVLKNYGDESISPWYKNSFASGLITPQWNFDVSELKSFE